jgi:hypothetical protein
MLGERVIGNILGNKPKKDSKSKNYTDVKNERSSFIYKGINVDVLFPSGYYEFYSEKQGRFLKADTIEGVKKLINEE